jgi:RNA polymerase sigma-70 factor (ECF subfamily)
MTEDCDALAASAVAGDRAATERLLALVRPPIVRYCRARIGVAPSGAASADDVAQEVLLALLTALPRYRDTGPGFVAFAHGIAAHKIADYHRHRQRSMTSALPDDATLADPGAEPEHQALDRDGPRRLRPLLERLNPQAREILTLRVIVGLSVAETAQAVDSAPGSVRAAQHRALRTLRRYLEEAARPNRHCSGC